MTNVLDTLEERGLLKDVNNLEGLREAVEEPITLYCGYDPTAPSLHIGHLVTIMMLSWFQRFGHRPIALVGAGTTMVGDPTFRQSSRPMLSWEQIEQNVQSVQAQLMHYLDFENERALLINNADWLGGLNFLDFMRDIGSRFSVNEVLHLEAYRSRLEAGGLSFLEFNYVLLQAYDFLRLHQDWSCSLQIGGSDQWGNSIMGADLIRRIEGKEAFVMTAPLIASATGAKMGKSVSGAVWLSLPPYEYYQFFRDVPDADVERFLAVFTFLDMDEVRRLGSLQGAELNHAKEVLAFEATKLRYGEEAALRAKGGSRAAFGGEGETEAIPMIEIERKRLLEGIPATVLFKEAGLAASANEVRNLIYQSGISINGVPVNDIHAMVHLDSATDGAIMLSRGKKRRMRIVLV